MSLVSARQRRATLALAALTSAVLVAAAVLGVVGVRAAKNFRGARTVNVTALSLPATPTALWVATDADNELANLMVIVDRPNSVGGSIVGVPIFANGATSAAPASFVEIFRRDGRDALVQAVGSVLRLDFDAVEFSTIDQLGTALQVFGEVPVRLVSPVVVAGDTLEPGSLRLTGDQLAAVLGDPSDGTDAGRAGNVAAVLTGIGESAGGGFGSGTAATAQSFDEIWTRALAGPVAAKLLGTQVGDAPVPAVDPLSAILVFGSIAPANMFDSGTGLVYRIEAPTGSEARVRDAIALILFSGGSVTQVQLSPDPPSAESVVTIYNDRDREKVEVSSEALGRVVYRQAAVEIEGVDVVVRLGTDFLSQPPVDHAPVNATVPAGATAVGTAVGTAVPPSDGSDG